MKGHRLRWLAVSLATAATSVAAPTMQSGGSQAPERTAQPPIRTEATFVRVDVYPTQDGRPVLGLTKEDFEVFEDGTPQKIEAFEHVVIHPAGPQAGRREPSTVRESLQEAANPRNRIFVLFLDVPHVSFDSSVRIREPLIRLIDRTLGPDDLVGVMTPAMSASHVVLGRKTEAIEAGLRRTWPWGERFQDQLDATEMKYVQCYPKLQCDRTSTIYSELATRLIQRKRELATLEALQDLVRYLGAIREERKAILAVTEGWLLLHEAPELMTLRECGNYKEPVPGIPDIQVDPYGKLTTRERRNPGDATKHECDTDRMRLASTNHERFFRDLMDDANRANASFYPIDPRGLAAFDSPMGPEAPPPPSLDRAMLTARQGALRTLAENTDGIAVMDNNDLDASLKRVADDLTSYYLLGYYSTNAKLDGGYRKLTVRVGRPGVDVRARRGYRAATAEEIASARKAADAPVPESITALQNALNSLARIRPEAGFRINAAAVAGTPGTVWVAGEIVEPVRQVDLTAGTTVRIEAVSGSESSTATITLLPRQRAFLTTVELPRGASGQLQIRARLTSEGSTIPLTDAVIVEDVGAIGQPLLFRRGPSTGNRVLPAADFRFSRSERLRLEIPVVRPTTPLEGRVLDRTGQPLPIPVTVGAREDDGTGQPWITADAMLAPLAPADYALEVRMAGTGADQSGEQRVLVAFRVVR